MKLYICSATKQLVLAVYNKNKSDFLYHIGNNDHSKTLMPLLDELLTRNNLEIKDIEEIVVSNGPGSYTGVRIGVVVAKSLALFNEIKLSKVSTLMTMASNIKGIVAPNIDARRDYVFAGIYEVGDDIKTIYAEEFMTKEKYLSLVEKYSAAIVSDTFEVNPYILKTTEADVYSLSPDYLRQWSE